MIHHHIFIRALAKTCDLWHNYTQPGIFFFPPTASFLTRQASGRPVDIDRGAADETQQGESWRP